MARIVTKLVTGAHGELSGMIAQDDTATFQIALAGWRAVFKGIRHDVSRYSDSGWGRTQTGILYGRVRIAGWLITGGTPGVVNIPEGTPAIATLIAGNNKSYSGTLRVMDMVVDNPLGAYVPCLIEGDFQGSVTETWSAAT